MGIRSVVKRVDFISYRMSHNTKMSVMW